MPVKKRSVRIQKKEEHHIKPMKVTGTVRFGSKKVIIGTDAVKSLSPSKGRVSRAVIMTELNRATKKKIFTDVLCE